MPQVPWTAYFGAKRPVRCLLIFLYPQSLFRPKNTPMWRNSRISNAKHHLPSHTTCRVARDWVPLFSSTTCNPPKFIHTAAMASKQEWDVQHALFLSATQENSDLFEQNNEGNTRASTKSTVVGKARVMSYEDIVEAQRKTGRERRR
jgi:hypothetical protein